MRSGTTCNETSPRDAHELLGQEVRIEKEGRVVRVGEVEAVTSSGDLLWIKASGCDNRALYGTALGHRVYPLEDAEVSS